MATGHEQTITKTTVQTRAQIQAPVETKMGKTNVDKMDKVGSMGVNRMYVFDIVPDSLAFVYCLYGIRKANIHTL